MSRPLNVAELIDRSSGPESCWMWTGKRDRDGYGRIGARLAHRVVYRMERGPIAPGLVVMHSCDNPPCLNPAHLKIGTQADNIADAVSKGRNRGRPRSSICPHGHVLDDPYVTGQGYRICRPCRNRRQTEWRHRRAAA